MAIRQELEFVITAKEDLTKQLKGIEGQLKGLQPAFKSMSLYGGIAFGIILAGITGAVNAGAKLEQTQVAFATMLGSEDMALRKLKELSDFASRTPFEINGIRDSAKQLLAYGVSADELIPTLKTLGDVTAGVGIDKFPQLTLAFGQVRAAGKLTGMELRQFTETGVPLLEALADHFGVTAGEIQEMTSAGVIKFKDVESALKSMTEEGGKFSDLMAKQALTASGQWSNFKDQITLTSEAIGTELLPIVKELVGTYLTPLITGIRELVSENPKLVTGIILIGGALAGLITAIGLLGQGIKVVVDGLKYLGSGLVGLFGKTGLLARGFGVLTTLFNAVRVGAIALGTALATVSAPVWLIVGAVVAVIAILVALVLNWEKVQTAIKNTNDTLQQWADTAQNATTQWVENTGNDISKSWDNFISSTNATLKSWGDSLYQVFDYALAVVQGALILFLDKFFPNWRMWLDNTLLMFKTGWENIKTALSDNLNGMMENVSNFFTTFSTFWLAQWEIVKGLFIGVWNSISSFLVERYGFIRGRFLELLGNINAIWSDFSSLFMSTWKSVWASVGEFFIGIWEGIKGGFKSAVNWIIEKINGLISSINKLIEGLNSVATVGGRVGKGIPSIPNIPMLAQGGVVTKPTLAMVGEGGEPEAVVPLSKMRDFGGGGVTVVLNIGTLIGAGMDMDELAELIGNNLLKQTNASLRF